jgi:hypothetical protein
MPPNTYSILAILHLIVFIWAIIDILKSGKQPMEKLLWLLVVLLLPLIGLIIYILIGRGK